MTFSYHAEVERANRLAALESTLGFTSVVLEVPMEDRLYRLTSSGVVIVVNSVTEVVITVFAATVRQCNRLYYWAGKKQPSPKMIKRIAKNEARHPELYTIMD